MKVEWGMTPLCLALGSFSEPVSVSSVEYFALSATGQSASLPLKEAYLQ